MKNKPLDYKSFLGKEYEITVNRPIGATHPKHPEIIYPINYGYIAGVFAEDGEEVDVYILGSKKPCQKCMAKIIAIIHRLNDDENKLVAKVDDKEYTKDEIRSLTHFQEQFYDIKVIK